MPLLSDADVGLTTAPGRAPAADGKPRLMTDADVGIGGNNSASGDGPGFFDVGGPLSKFEASMGGPGNTLQLMGQDIYHMVEPFVPGGPTSYQQSASETRPISQRISDTAAGLTGLAGVTGDTLRTLGAPEAGQSLEDAQRSFQEHNGPQLQAAGQIGYSLGGLVPEVSTAGAGRIPFAASVPGKVAKFDHMPPEDLLSRMRDAASFRAIDSPVFGPSLGDKGTARLARTIEELPIVGSTVKGVKTEVEKAARATVNDLKSTLNAPETADEAGRILQRGLDRQRNAGIGDLPAADVRAIGIEPTIQATRQNTMSRGARDRLAEAERLRQSAGMKQTSITSRGEEVAASRPMKQTQIVRRSASGVDGVPGSSLQDWELQQIVRPEAHGPTRPGERLPAIDPLSFASRQEALYEQAFRRIPEFRRIDGTRDPGEVAATNTRSALQTIRGQIANDISGQSVLSGPTLDRFLNPRSPFVFDDLRSIRTEIGRKLGNFNPLQSSLDRSQLKHLYAAISNDIENALTDYASKARVNSVPGKANMPNYVHPDVAKNAEGALAAFRRADRYTRVSMDRMDRFSNLVGAQNPAEAARALGRYMTENASNPGAVKSVMSALRPEERNQIAGHIIGRLGMGRAGAVEAENVFNFNHWATDWNKLGDQGQRLLMQHLTADVRHKLLALGRVAERMKRYETTRNYSGTAYTGVGLLSVGAYTSGVSGLMTALASTAGAAALGKFLTSDVYLGWLLSAARASHSKPSAMMMGKQLDRLKAIAAKDRDHGMAILRAIAIVEKQNEDAQRQQLRDSELTFTH